MGGSVFGKAFTISTFGESHGPAVGVVVDGMPAGIPLEAADVQRELDRRRPGQSAISTPRSEADTVEILSGVFQGLTTGHPVGMMVRNANADSSDYERFKELYRPGHADYSHQVKYGIRDWRGSGRASGRETASRVAAGALARKLLDREGITVRAWAREIAGIRAVRTEPDVVERNPVRTCDPDVVEAMVAAITAAREQADSVGGIVELVISGCPPGLGEPVFDKLGARLAFALMGLGAVKGVEIGAGFGAAGMRGSEFNDPFTAEGTPRGRPVRVRTRTNNAGGILGGISTGEDIVMRVAVRPPASIGKEQETVDVNGGPARITVRGRHDPCIVPRIVPVIEAMAAIVLADALLLRAGERSYQGPSVEGKE
jgi:chorismate synthase